MTPIQTPITGAEDLASFEGPLAALVGFYRAFNGRDLSLMVENWENSGEASMDNPLGGIKRGWDEIRLVYERIFGGEASVQIQFHDYTLHCMGDVFMAVGRERGTLRNAGMSLDLRIRTSRVFSRGSGGWRQVHHHGSIDDPDLLARYQAAVR